jgi:DNA-binding transcriptional LysR family regulator
MTLLQLQVFIVVCQEKSFTRAGEALKMTQSAVSQAIGNLENELGVRLLNRDRHGITVTHIGERVLSHARDMMQHTYEMHQEVTAAIGSESGTLRIAVTPTVSARLLPELLASFHSSHPDIQTTVLEGEENEVNNWLVNHFVDVSFTAQPADGLDVAGSVSDEFLLFIPKDHKFTQYSSVSLKQIQDEPYIQLKSDSVSFIKESFKQQGLSQIVKYEFGEICTILAMIEKGLGVSILPKMSIPVLPPHVTGIALSPPLTRNIQLVVRDMNRITPTCADFVLHVKEHIENDSFKSLSFYAAASEHPPR